MEGNMMKQKKLKKQIDKVKFLHLDYAFLITSLMFFYSCNEKSTNNKASSFKNETHMKIMKERKVNLFNVENKNVEIEIVESQMDIFKKKHLLLCSDSLFNENVLNQSNDIKYYKGLFQKYWDSEYDWYVNAMLYSEFQVGAIGMIKFAPNKVEKWRIEDKKMNGEFWSAFLDTADANNW